MSELEYHQLRHELVEIKALLKLLLPKEYPIGYLAQQTGKSRQSVRSWLIRNGEPDVDFWEKGGKIFVSEKAALSYLSQRRL